MSGVDKKLVRAWVRQQSGPARRAALPVVLAALFGTITGIGQAWCIAGVIGIVLAGTNQPTGPYILAFLLLAFLRSAIMCLQERASILAGMKARVRLRHSVLDAVIGIGPALLRRHHSGEIAALMVDRIEVLDGYFARWTPASMTWMLLPLVTLAFVFRVNPHAAMILAICGVLVPVAQAVFGIGAALASRNQFLAMVRLQARFLDRVRGIATIVLANATETEAKALADSAADLRRRTMKILRVAFLSSAAIDIAMVAAIVLIVMTQGHFLSSGLHPQPRILASPQITATVFALFLVPEFFAPLRSLALAYQDRAHAAGAAEAMDGLDAGETPAQGQTGEATELASDQPVTVIVEDLAYRWGADLPAVFENLSFSVGAGDILVLDGPSGAGKSTLIEALLGFIRPGSGRILFNGQDIADVRGRDIARVLAWIGQRPVLFAGTMRANLLFARPDATDEELNRAIRAAAIDRFLPSLPDGLDTLIGEGGFGLSGGQAQRVAIARAYLKDAPLLLLDEPTAHLDPQTEADIISALVRLAEGRTVILSSHSGAVRALGTRILALPYGTQREDRP